MSPKHARYQDYVIKDGKLVGEFEEMYQDFLDPWEQSVREEFSLEKMLGIQLIKWKQSKSVLELGCGFGHYINKITSECGCVGTGIDVSKTAIEKGRQKYSENKNLTLLQGAIDDEALLLRQDPDVLVMAEITWYVLDYLDAFKKFLTSHLTGKHILHLLMTYKPGEQQYGREFFTNLDEIRAYFSDVVAFENWGQASAPELHGGARTFFWGKIK